MKLQVNPYAPGQAKDDYQDDILNFKDSDRESLISYMQSAAALQVFQGTDHEQYPIIDTPTRLVNESNEFLEHQLTKKRKLHAKRLDGLKLIVHEPESTLSSQERKLKQDKKDKLLLIFE